jgi:hypothetical protein
MVSQTRSENLNPQFWRKLRALVPKNTAPIAKESVLTFESGETRETEYALVPISSVDKLKDYVPVDRLTAQKILEQAPALHESKLLQEKAHARANAGHRLAPLAHSSTDCVVIETKVTANAGNTLNPVSSVDQLDGYEPKFFLKEDGKDYE